MRHLVKYIEILIGIIRLLFDHVVEHIILLLSLLQELGHLDPQLLGALFILLYLILVTFLVHFSFNAFSEYLRLDRASQLSHQF